MHMCVHVHVAVSVYVCIKLGGKLEGVWVKGIQEGERGRFDQNKVDSYMNKNKIKI